MSGFDGNGNFFFTYNWVNDAANGIPITASRMDGQFNDAVGGFDLCVTRDGQGKMGANFIADSASLYDIGSSSVPWRVGYYGQLGVSNNQDAPTFIGLFNNSAGTSAQSVSLYQNGTGTVQIGILGTGFTPSGILTANTGFIFTDGSTAGGLAICSAASAPIKFAAGGTTESMRIGTDGSLLKGTTTDGGWTTNSAAEIRAAGNALSCYDTTTTGAALLCRVDSSSAQLINFFGNVTNVGSITTNGTIIVINGTSDERLKNDLGDFEPGNLFDQIRVHRFTWKATGEEGHSPFAQELNEVRSDLVQAGHGEPGDEDFRPWMVSSTGIIWDLVAEVKALRARVATLEAR